MYTNVQQCATSKSELRQNGRQSRIPGSMAAKDERIGIRVSSELKRVLAQIAKKEGRSLGQICDLFLTGGAQQYEDEGSMYISSLLASSKKRSKHRTPA
jgi:hypothetical protein